MFQKTIIAGYLGRDPEMRFTADGTPVTTLSVAVNNWDDTTTWFRVTAWRKLAENANQYLSKGRAVLIEGTLQSDPATGGPKLWAGKDGEVRASFELTAREITFLPSGRVNETPDGLDYDAPQPQANESDSDGGEIPF